MGMSPNWSGDHRQWVRTPRCRSGTGAYWSCAGLGSAMLVVLGLIILMAAVTVGVAGVLGTAGSEHALTDGFSLFGYHVSGSTGTVFLTGIVVLGRSGALPRTGPAGIPRGGMRALSGLSPLAVPPRPGNAWSRKGRAKETAGILTGIKDIASGRLGRPSR